MAGLLVVGALGSAPAAWAHGNGETEEGYLLVQQALGHLSHDKGSAGIDLAMEKIDDTLATKDQEGVNVAEVKKAQAALEAGQVAEGRTLLQQSITEAMSKLATATGEETGTKVILDAIPGRGPLTGLGWAFLAASVVLLLLGGAAAWHFRPADTVRQLRQRLGDPRAAKGVDAILPLKPATSLKETP